VPSRWQGRGRHERDVAKEATNGAKGRGEPSRVGCAVIANVYRATGTRSRDLPITVEKLL
jgi:CO/xanthine dehydrogenase Mo-binding subunit